jgi:hypothetical protein
MLLRRSARDTHIGAARKYFGSLVQAMLGLLEYYLNITCAFKKQKIIACSSNVKWPA